MNPAPAETKPVTITLIEPIQRESGLPITEINLRKPRAGELRGLKVEDLFNTDINALLVLLPRIASPTLIGNQAEQLCTEDMMEVAGAVRGFFMSQAVKTAVMRQFGMETENEPSSE